MSDIVASFQSLGIDTKAYGSGSHYVACPKCSHERKKKNNKVLLINFSTGWYQCFHCEFKGFAQNADRNKDFKPSLAPPPKLAQQFLPEPEWNWILKDATIDPKPEDPLDPTSPSTVTWYYRDIKGRLTSAKRMVYNFTDDGQMKRDKDHHPLFITTRDGGYYPSLFNEHMLSLHPIATVILVESEKTASFMSHKFKAFLDEFIYIATSGAQGLTDEKSGALRNRNIWIIYDCDNAELDENGKPKNIKGREGAKEAESKLQKIANPRVIDLDPSKNDGTDLGDIYREINIDYIRGLGATIPEEVLDLWQQTEVIEKPQEIPALISVQGLPTIRMRNISLIIGKKKSRKTLFIVWLLSEGIKQGLSVDEIILFDTEQDEYDVWLVRDRLFRMTGKYVSVFTLGTKSTKDRKDIIYKTIQHRKKTPKICVVDGIRDLMRDINSIEETSDIIDWLQNIKGSFGTHMMCILHQNKTSKDARGHIGSELLNKAEITIELERDEKTGCTLVKVESARKRHFDPFAFTHSQDDLPEIVDAPVGGVLMPVEERKKRTANVFRDGPMNYKALVDNVAAEFAVGVNKAKQYIKEFQRNNWIIKNGKDGSPTTTYAMIMGNEIPQEIPSNQLPLIPEEDELPF